MALSQKDIKLIWGRAGSRCAICRCELSHDADSGAGAFVLGEQAHIVGEKDDAPRGKSVLTPEERNSYHNMILLCPTDHSKIDKNESDWPVEKLYQVKSKHELWVREALSSQQDLKSKAADLIVSSAVDRIVSMTRLEEWTEWTSFAFSPNTSWPEHLPDDIFRCLERLISTIWPAEFEEVEVASQHFVRSLHTAAGKFMENSELLNGRWCLIRFYKEGGWNSNYEADLQRFNHWQRECFETLRTATKAANWFADVVRRDVNPLFFAEKGRFLISDGPFLDGTFECYVPSYTAEEIRRLLASGSAEVEQYGGGQPATRTE